MRLKKKTKHDKLNKYTGWEVIAEGGAGFFLGREKEEVVRLPGGGNLFTGRGEKEGRRKKRNSGLRRRHARKWLKNVGFGGQGGTDHTLLHERRSSEGGGF